MHRSILLLVCLLFLSSATATSDIEAVESHLNSTETTEKNLSDLLSFLRIPSVSALPTHKSDVRAAAVWIKDYLSKIGLENARLLETSLHPSVYADWLHAPDAPTVLIYAHFDVQPADPENLWTTPPFEPSVRDGRIYARGATDDKGNLMVPVAAIAAYLKVLGKLPVNVKIFFEGEEEIGSPSLQELLKKHRDLLRADFSLSADGAQIDLDKPGICIALRGAVALEVTVKGGDTDLHSGLYGGGVQNPLHALSHMLASMRDIHTSRVLVNGFYDDVDELSDEERTDIAEFPLNPMDMLVGTGIKKSVGENGFSFFERTWCRPSLEIVGMGGGFQGDGVKTVLPREASAKIAARIVSSQTPKKVGEAIKSHLEREAAKIDGITVELKNLGFEADPYKMGKDGGGNLAAAKVLHELYGRKPVFFRMGGSIPVAAYIQKILGIDTTFFAFAGKDENAHAPDEFSRLATLRRGEIAYVRLLENLGETGLKEEL